MNGTNYKVHNREALSALHHPGYIELILQKKGGLAMSFFHPPFSSLLEFKNLPRDLIPMQFVYDLVYIHIEKR
jgi:hypothetical protein